MGWLSLGTISPDWQWQQFDIPVLGDALIRVSQTYDEPSLGRIINKVIFGEVYADLGRRTLFGVYRKADPRLYTLTIPQEISERGFGVRYLEAKHNAWGVINPDSWSVEVEVWQETDTSGNTTLIADGGSYDGI